ALLLGVVSDTRTVQTAAIRAQRVTLPAARLPQAAVPNRRCQTECHQCRCVVVDPALQTLPIEVDPPPLGQADVEIRPVRCHRLHAPVPPVVAAMVLRPLEMPGAGMV